MLNRSLPTQATSNQGYPATAVTINAPMQSSQLMRLFEDELKDIYWVEKALVNIIPKMIKNSTSQELVGVLTHHLNETEQHVRIVERVFHSMEKKPMAKKCLAMEGLIKEVGEMMESSDAGAMCDAGIMSAEQKIGHYEIASYETLRLFAEILGLEEAVELFETTLEERKSSVERFADVSISAIHLDEQLEEGDEESELDQEQAYYLQLI
jgi:ferritin-like metal-binding protein YciE